MMKLKPGWRRRRGRHTDHAECIFQPIQQFVLKFTDILQQEYITNTMTIIHETDIKTQKDYCYAGIPI